MSVSFAAALSFIEARVVLVRHRGGRTVSRRGVPREIFFCSCAAAAVGTRNYSIFRDGRSQSLRGQGERERGRKGGPPENMKERASSWAHCFMTFHLDLSLDEATDSVGIPVFLSVGLLGPVVAFRRACAAPRGSCLSIVRPSGRPKPHLPQNT